jgi:hypothetical protein
MDKYNAKNSISISTVCIQYVNAYKTAAMNCIVSNTNALPPLRVNTYHRPHNEILKQ